MENKPSVLTVASEVETAEAEKAERTPANWLHQNYLTNGALVEFSENAAIACNGNRRAPLRYSDVLAIGSPELVALIQRPEYDGLFAKQKQRIEDAKVLAQLTAELMQTKGLDKKDAEYLASKHLRDSKKAAKQS